MQANQPNSRNNVQSFAWVAQLILLFVLVLLTNHGFTDRVDGLVRRQNWLVLSVFVGVWVLSLLCLAIAAQQPNRAVRLFWAVVIAIATGLAHSFYLASGADLNIFYVLSFWTARHEAGRAIEFYQDVGVWVAVVLIAFLAVLYLPPTVRNQKIRKFISRLAWAPAMPIILMAAIIVTRDGSGSQAMPRQFQPLAIGVVASGLILTDDAPERDSVNWHTKSQPAVRNIVFLVDESIRPDYINWNKGNPYTPMLAANKERVWIFGQALSGGNCSSFSNAILRLGGTRRSLVKSIKSNPTIWQYAKRAGFRTVYIDGQSTFIKSDKKLQNFMTFQELKQVDRHVTFDNVPTPQLDFELLSTVAAEIKGDKPVFILANKNGAHFPYDAGYPESEARFQPVIGPQNVRDPAKMINSYRNVIRWSVDKFFGKLLTELDLSETFVIYTSDHGQHIAEHKLTHCSVENPDPRQALVPLFATTQNNKLKMQLAAAVNLNRGKLTHFAIAPTLLELMGYDRADIATRYDASIFEPQAFEPAFTSEYIFGLFRSKVKWTPVDLSAEYLEPLAKSTAAQVEQ